MREWLRVVPGSDLFLGLDISTASWHVTARSGGETLLSASFPPKREALTGLLKRLDGCHLHSVYEAGPFGYGLHDWLRSRHVDSVVVSAAHVPGEVSNRVKTDRRDGLKLARTLEAGLLTPIYVPEARQRADRELVRQRQRVQRDRCAAMVRLKSFFLTYDIEVPEEGRAHWSGAFEAWLRGLTLEDSALNRVLEELRSLYFELDRRVDLLATTSRAVGPGIVHSRLPSEIQPYGLRLSGTGKRPLKPRVRRACPSSPHREPPRDAWRRFVEEFERCLLVCVGLAPNYEE